MYRKIQHNPQEEIKFLYLRINDTFYYLYLERERNTDKTITVIDDSRILKDLFLKWVTEKNGTTKVRENITAWKGNCRYHQEFFFL
jgi:hypothetical protein